VGAGRGARAGRGSRGAHLALGDATAAHRGLGALLGAVALLHDLRQGVGRRSLLGEPLRGEGGGGRGEGGGGGERVWVSGGRGGVWSVGEGVGDTKGERGGGGEGRVDGGGRGGGGCGLGDEVLGRVEECGRGGEVERAV